MRTIVRYNRIPSLVARYASLPAAAPRYAAPAVNVTEDEKAYSLELAAPGFRKEDFTIRLVQNQLTISARREEKPEEKGGNYTRREFGYGAFERSFRLPARVDAEQIKAAYVDGVLKLELPKKEEKKPETRQIAVA